MLADYHQSAESQPDSFAPRRRGVGGIYRADASTNTSRTIYPHWLVSGNSCLQKSRTQGRVVNFDIPEWRFPGPTRCYCPKIPAAWYGAAAQCILLLWS